MEVAKENGIRRDEQDAWALRSHTLAAAAVADHAWSEMVFDISAIADGQPTVYVRWTMGATDNGTGTITMLEAMRIISQAYPRPRRTILVGHWGAEEQGLVGSRSFTVRANASFQPFTTSSAVSRYASGKPGER